MSEEAIYLRIMDGEPLPDVGVYAPFRAVVVIDAEYSTPWQNEVSDWLVQSGCLYMMAWGKDCTTWDDSVDEANREQLDYGEIPDDKFVMTTWHDKQALDDVFWEAQFAADHGDVELRSSLIVHIGEKDRREELLARFAVARDQP